MCKFLLRRLFVHIKFFCVRTLTTSFSYEERATTLKNIIVQHKQPTTFEDFTSKVFAPVLPQSKMAAHNSLARSRVPITLQCCGLQVATSPLPPSLTPHCSSCPTVWRHWMEETTKPVQTLRRVHLLRPPKRKVRNQNSSPKNATSLKIVKNFGDLVSIKLALSW